MATPSAFFASRWNKKRSPAPEGPFPHQPGTSSGLQEYVLVFHEGRHADAASFFAVEKIKTDAEVAGAVAEIFQRLVSGLRGGIVCRSDREFAFHAVVDRHHHFAFVFR